MQIFQEIWQKYKETQETSLTRSQVIAVIKEYNYEAGELLIQGYQIPIKGIGSLQFRIMPTNYKRKIIDWQKSIKGKDGKYEKLVYRVRDTFPILFWSKPRLGVFSFTKFIPSKGGENKHGNIIRRFWSSWNEGKVSESNFLSMVGNCTYQRYLNGELDKTYSSKSNLSSDYTANQINNINKVVDNSNRTAYGFTWKTIRI